MKGGLRTLLSGKLEPSELRLLHRSYDIVGDIAVIRVPEPLQHRSGLVAEAITETYRHVKTVLRQTGPVSGGFRLRGLEWVAGEKKTETVHREHGCAIKVDLAKCYFSPRLSHERMRVARLVRPGEVVVNMFAGVGCYSVLIARHSQAEKVYSIDLNPDAVRYMVENIRLNGAQTRVEAILGDAKDIIGERLMGVADRVLMPLPQRAYEYLDSALLALRLGGGWVHYYDFEHARKPEDPLEKVRARVSEKLRRLGVGFEVPSCRVVRATGPNWYQVALDVKASRRGDKPCP